MSVEQLQRFLKRPPLYQPNEFTIVGEQTPHRHKDIFGGLEELAAVHHHLVTVIGGEEITASTVSPKLRQMFGGTEGTDSADSAEGTDETPSGYESSAESAEETPNDYIGAAEGPNGGNEEPDDYWDVPDNDAAAVAAVDDISLYLN